MITLKIDIVLEIAKYLDIQDLFSLAHSCSVAYRASEFHSFWRPFENHIHNELSTFVSTTEIKSWRSLRGSDIRLAVGRLYEYKRNWVSEKPQAKVRVKAILNGCSLRSVPGSRWLYSSCSCSTKTPESLVFLDGRTGLTTERGIDFTPPGTDYQNETVIFHSLGPNKILVGACGDDEDGECSFAIFHVTFFLDEKDGSEFLGFAQKQIRIWNIPRPYQQAIIDSQFLALSMEIPDSDECEINIYHIWSGRTLAIFQVPHNLTVFLIDNWCFLALENSHEGIQLVSIHLPTLLKANVVLKQLSPPNEEDFILGVNSCQVSILRYRCFSHSFNDQEYTIEEYDQDLDLDHVFNVRVECIPNSLYGRFRKMSEKRVRPDHQSLRPLITPHSIMSKFGVYNNEDIVLSPVYHGSWMVVRERVNRRNDGEVYYVASTDPDIPPCAIDWSTPRNYPAQTGKSEGAELAIQDLFVEHWDPWAGLIVLSDGKNGSSIYSRQICWF